MRACALSCAVAMVAVPASATNLGLVVDLLPGHAIYDEGARQAGVVTAIAITQDQGTATDLKGLCEELRVAAGLRPEHGQLPLEVIFIVPHKAMAIEGYYLPADGAPESEALVAGGGVARETLDRIVGRAGIPSGLLDEKEVEHEVSCELDEPAWHVRWQDVRLLDGQEPDAVIDQAYLRFAAIHQSVLDHAKGSAQLASRAVGSSGLARRALP